MTNISHKPQSATIKQEVRQLQDAARKIVASQESARKFLVSTGMYKSSGQLKPQFR